MNGSKGHLDRLLDVCHARGLSLPTALRVNNEKLKVGLGLLLVARQSGKRGSMGGYLS
jgi:hypothetical protein